MRLILFFIYPWIKKQKNLTFHKSQTFQIFNSFQATKCTCFASPDFAQKHVQSPVSRFVALLSKSDHLLSAIISKFYHIFYHRSRKQPEIIYISSFYLDFKICASTLKDSSKIPSNMILWTWKGNCRFLNFSKVQRLFPGKERISS